MADLGAMLEQLKQERTKLDKAIEALSGLVGNHSGTSGRVKRILSPARSKANRSGPESQVGEVQGEESGVGDFPELSFRGRPVELAFFVFSLEGGWVCHGCTIFEGTTRCRAETPAIRQPASK
jgi:hypothetical protein